MKKTRILSYLTKCFFVLSLFFTSCTFCETWRTPFPLNTHFKWLKFLLAFLLPITATVLSCLAQGNLHFSGNAAACLMALFIILYYADRLTVNYIACFGDFMVSYHFAYALISFFSVLLGAWLCLHLRRNRPIGFAAFYCRFFTGYLFVFIFLFIQIFFILRQQGQSAVTVNLIPFQGEIGRLTDAVRQGGISALDLMQTVGNLLFFATVPLLMGTFIKKHKTLLMPAAPIALSLLAEISQYFLRMGDTDIDDLILNTVGGLAGFLIYRLLLEKHLKEDKACSV